MDVSEQDTLVSMPPIDTGAASQSTCTISIPMTSDRMEAKNQKRCSQILECKREISDLQRQLDGWNEQLQRLQDEQTRCFCLASLRLNAKTTWEQLDEEKKVDKMYILAALESKELPEELDDFCNGDFPPAIRMDRDILLARVKRDDFEAKYREERFFVPPKLRADKEVIRAVIVKHPAVVETMACSLRDDANIFLALLSNRDLPAQVLQHFSENIRADFDLMIKLSSHPDGLRSFCFISQSLRNNKDFMMQAIQVTHHQAPTDNALIEPLLILRYASHRLRDDYDVVIAAVQKCGANLKHASYDRRRDRPIVVAATEQHGTAFRYCLPGSTRDELVNDTSFMLENIGRRCPNELLRIPRFCFENLTSDREALLITLEAGLDWSNVPFEMQIDEDFVVEAVRRNHELYMDIHEIFRENNDIARSVIEAPDVDANVLLEATEQCPQLLSDRDAMLTIAKAWWADVLQETLRYSPMEIRGNKKIMVEAVKNDPYIYELVSDELSTDPDIVLTAVAGSPSLLSIVEREVQRENPDIVVAAIMQSTRSDLRSLLPDIHEELFQNRAVALAWVSQGGSCVVEPFPSEYRNDEEIMLAVAGTNWEEFQYAGSDLLDNKEFLRQAIAIDANVIDDAEGNELIYDFDLALLAFSQKAEVLRHFCDFSDDDDATANATAEEDFAFVASFTKRIRNRIREYDTFKYVVERNMIHSPQTTHPSSLSILDQGPETRHLHSERISDYLGLSSDVEVQMMKKASANLVFWGF
ncbi:MAG: hypothetical protein SGILL_008978 [Bacillariaceae sp.]